MSVLDHDILAGLERDLGDAEIVREVVQLFLDQLAERQLAISTAIEAGEVVRAQREAHTLGSASAMVGAVELRGLCRRLETIDPADGVDPADSLVRAWSASCTATEAAMTSWLAES